MTELVIAVDLDGTVTCTDTLHESALRLLRDNPIAALTVLFSLLKGKAALKAKIADRVNLDAVTLPYNTALIDWLKEERAAGRPIVLCTAADYRIAQAIARYLGCFDEVLASNGISNNAGLNKRAALEARYGHKGYDYVGNSKADIPAWTGARLSILVNATNSTAERVAQVATVSRVFSAPVVTLSHGLKMIRIHQWLKNMLLFVPLIAAHQLNDFQSLFTLIIAFVSFGLGASAAYIMNDLIDVESDRRHPRKRYRAFASGAVPIKVGAVIALLFAVISLLIGLVVGVAFAVWLISYLLLTCVYSLWLKRFALIDCFTLSILYTARIEAGAAAVELAVSFWLLTFSTFIFFSLALVKRYAELDSISNENTGKIPGRGYYTTDTSVIRSLGVTAGITAVLVFSLYLQSERVLALYAQPELAWVAIPLMLYWTAWIWLNADRGLMHDDPIVFALREKTSLLIAALILVFLILAKFGTNDIF
jgi:4-hydroxybenzoate polyprenyltransferase